MQTKFPVKWIHKAHQEDKGQYRYGWLVGFATSHGGSIEAMVFVNQKLEAIPFYWLEVALVSEVHANTNPPLKKRRT